MEYKYFCNAIINGVQLFCKWSTIIHVNRVQLFLNRVQLFLNRVQLFLNRVQLFCK